MTIFVLLLATQFFAMAFFFAISMEKLGIPLWAGRQIFRPKNWFLLFFFLSFICAQLIFPLANFQILGLDVQDLDERIRITVHTQLILLAFLVTIIAGYCVTISWTRHQHPSRIDARRLGFSQTTRIIMWPMLLIGAMATCYLALKFDDGPRSQLVKTLDGRIAYALSFFGTFAACALSATWWLRGRVLLSVLLLVLSGALLFLLGGRGRVLWPLVYVMVYVSVVGNLRVKPMILGLSIISLFIILQTLDPLLLFLKGETAGAAVDRLADGADLIGFFLQRTFDGFHNLSVITHLDRISPSMMYLVNSPSDYFMQEYFPDVMDAGVGFPATLPGELWIGGRIVVLLAGGALFGFFLGLYEKWYWSITWEGELWVYILSMVWLTAVGGAYLSQALKTFAAVLPAIFVFLTDICVRPSELRRLVVGRFAMR